MAFARANFALVYGENSSAGRVYAYRTADALATVRAADYFLEVTDQLQKGDRIIVGSSVDGTPAAADCIVTAATSSTVTVAAA